MSLREANLKPGDKLDVLRTGLEVREVGDKHVSMTNGITYTLDKVEFSANVTARAKVKPDFWPPQKGDVWEGGDYLFFGVCEGLRTVANLCNHANEALLSYDNTKLVFRQGVTDRDYEVQGNKLIDLSKKVNDKTVRITELENLLDERTDDVDDLNDEICDLKDELTVARSVAKDARKEADSYLKQLQDISPGRWEYKLTYPNGAESCWTQVYEDVLDWNEMPSHYSIQKVSFRKAKS